jgi:CHAT domain-containing protein/tetratricopeptide (TPR) repeat protein
VNSHLLAFCAILRWFDVELLLALTECAESEVAWLLESGLVAVEPQHGGVYSLQPQQRDEILARLRAERPHDELALHTRAFEHFLRRMAARGEEQQRWAEEDACFYHLDRLSELLAPHGAWQTLAQYVAAATEARPEQKRNRQHLAYYDGLVAIRTSDFERGVAVMAVLLDDGDLEESTRLRALNSLARAFYYQTQYDLALARYQQVFRLAEATGDRFFEAAALINMGMVYNELANYERALALTLQSLVIFRELGDRRGEATALYEIGNSALQLGRWSVAQEHLAEAVTLAELLGQTARLSDIFWAQGLLHHLAGDDVESEASYTRALALSQAPERNDLKRVNAILWYLGFLYHTQGRSDEAFAAYEQALALSQRLKRAHWLSLIHYQRGNLFRHLGRLREARAAYEQGIEAIERLRGDSEGEEVKFGLIGTTQQLYEAMVLLCLEQGLPEDAFNYVERARSRAFLDTLLKKDPHLYEALDQPVATLADLQAQLPDGVLLLEYFTTGIAPPGENIVRKLPPESAHLREYLLLPPRVLLFIVTRDDLEVREVALDPNMLQPHAGARHSMRHLLRARQLAYLHERLIEPVQNWLNGCEFLYLIPHGPLHHVPWMALRSARGDYLLDADGAAIALAPSATILLCRSPEQPTDGTGEFLALGYNDVDAQALRYAETEARFLARLMDGQAWVGEQPKVQQLLARREPTRWLHISGHGTYHPHDPLGSALHIGADDSLTARDILGHLELPVELVTLSACASGLTYILPGDELLGLPRAFLYAGAPTIVCAPWEAPDLVALLLMERFYSYVRQGQRPAAALRDAAVSLRRMTGRDLVNRLAHWCERYPEETSDLQLPRVGAEQMDQLVFADPSYWALFFVIGRG